MVNFELDNEMQKVNNMINMTLAWDKQKIWVPDRNQTHDQPNTRQVLCPLSYENSWIELISYVTGVLHTTKISTVEVIMSSGKWIKMVNSHDDFDSAGSGSMQDACHIWTKFNDQALHELSQLSG